MFLRGGLHSHPEKGDCSPKEAEAEQVWAAALERGTDVNPGEVSAPFQPHATAKAAPPPLSDLRKLYSESTGMMDRRWGGSGPWTSQMYCIILTFSQPSLFLQSSCSKHLSCYKAKRKRNNKVVIFFTPFANRSPGNCPLSTRLQQSTDLGSQNSIILKET